MSHSSSSPGKPSPLAELFPDAGFRFQMRFKRETVAEYFSPTSKSDAVLVERGAWLEQAAEDCAAFLPEARPALEETCEVLAEAGVLPGLQITGGFSNPLQPMIEVGRQLEPDFLLLGPDGESGEFRLLAGCVCFPSSWALSEKIGRPIDVIHGVVPGLNQQLAKPISQFLRRMEPGIAWCRENWGLSRSPELNQHPDRRLPRLDSSVEINDVWLRVERQALIALPKSGGVLFGIRVEVHPLQDVRRDAAASSGLMRALESMPEPVAEYKGLSTARPQIIKLLTGSTS